MGSNTLDWQQNRIAVDCLVIVVLLKTSRVNLASWRRRLGRIARLLAGAKTCRTSREASSEAIVLNRSL
jgi:hypothetical protein